MPKKIKPAENLAEIAQVSEGTGLDENSERGSETVQVELLPFDESAYVVPESVLAGVDFAPLKNAIQQFLCHQLKAVRRGCVENRGFSYYDLSECPAASASLTNVYRHYSQVVASAGKPLDAQRHAVSLEVLAAKGLFLFLFELFEKWSLIGEDGIQRLARFAILQTRQSCCFPHFCAGTMVSVCSAGRAGHSGDG
uniref:Uncharacterized protein n=1 Tax=Chromera velia CCMP2878 TaxID=1169474 RepID=A0A0G4I5W8_9ALVE|eukprot:Cvel_62.t1-p1 / transcript=Cvel_62.t1 / gene=Cvel_62 / organism=Chromera_velia_CCMP2878 / gene_product=hypothetical protein / transcript_product=hypothetical protein / location=Cvel_scaffold6:60238-60822(-) / protein_length=195 / sequence_SO=supercontig / SO=protein_coding / is_pseudo=false